MKKCFLILAFAVISAGVGFAQDFESMPKNTLTVDLGPTLVGLGFGATSSIAKGVLNPLGVDISFAGIKTTGFGIGAQYERQLMENLSVAGRFAYLQCGSGIGNDDANVKIDTTSYSIEGHIRYYTSEAFFLDGMLGYANMKTSFKGNIADNHVDFSVPKDYFKLGLKLGWRIDFGNPGGFVFEPSFGWSFGILVKGDTILRAVVDATNGDLSEEDEKLYKYIEMGFDNLIFVGGPRLSLAFGFRF